MCALYEIKAKLIKTMNFAAIIKRLFVELFEHRQTEIDINIKYIICIATSIVAVNVRVVRICRSKASLILISA